MRRNVYNMAAGDGIACANDMQVYRQLARRSAPQRTRVGCGRHQGAFTEIINVNQPLNFALTISLQ
jgi:hypothetical protein